MHLLRAAHFGSSDRSGQGEPRHPGWRSHSCLRPGLPDRGHCVRESPGPKQPCEQAEEQPAELRHARRTEYLPSHDLSSETAQSESGFGKEPRFVTNMADAPRTSTAEAETEVTTLGYPARLIGPGENYASVTETIGSIVLSRQQPRAWWFGFAISFSLVMLLLFAISYLLIRGIGIWGVN